MKRNIEIVGKFAGRFLVFSLLGYIIYSGLFFIHHMDSDIPEVVNSITYHIGEFVFVAVFLIVTIIMFLLLAYIAENSGKIMKWIFTPISKKNKK